MLTIKITAWVLVGLLGYWLARRSFRKYRARSTRIDGTLNELARWYFWPDIHSKAEVQPHLGFVGYGSIGVALGLLALAYAIFFHSELSSTYQYLLGAWCVVGAGILVLMSVFAARGKLWPFLAWVVLAGTGILSWLFFSSGTDALEALISFWFIKDTISCFRSWMWLKNHPEVSTKFDPSYWLVKPRKHDIGGP